jgi:N-acetyl-anhydromuramyl-L-alanine amidase AmpD
MVPCAQAHPQAQPSAIEISVLDLEPSLDEVEQALADAAWEFQVPLELMAVIAHTESHWRHRPERTSRDGRRGLLSLSPDRILLAAHELGTTPQEAVQDLRTHTRAFALLLSSQRPEAPIGLGAWRDALTWTLELSPVGSEQLVDRWFYMLDSGVIDRLDSGEPIAIPPTPISSNYLGLFAASMGNQARSADYPGASWNPAASCNTPYCLYPRIVGDVDMVVIHTAEGSYAGTISWFQNCDAGVSAHYVVSEAGSITQMVAEEYVGWHISACNGHSIGIEHEGYAADTWHPDALYQSSAALLSDILTDWSIPVDRDHIVGHNEVQSLCSTNHWDPGPGWDWNYYMSLIGGENTVDLTELVGYIRHTDLYDTSAGIAGATVSIDGHGTTQADSAGYYVFDEIPPGTWTICASASGYDNNCITKTVQADLTNWGSILLELALGDDDDTSGDDDDTSGDDDDTSGDDDDTSGDDDDTTWDDDDSSGDEEAAGRDRNGCGGCATSQKRITPASWLLLLPLLSLVSRRRRSARAPQN